MSNGWLTIGDLVARTGVGEPTLRMWERRHGFPQPARTTNGHRRYSQEQAEMVERVIAARATGLSLSAAIDRIQHVHPRESWSPFATLRRRQPDLEPRLIGKRALVALSHAIEDEIVARAERPIIFGCFQQVRFYRQEQARWLELTRGAHAAAVFADFEAPAAPVAGPAEIPIAYGDALSREWALIAYGDRYAVCLSAREPASSSANAQTSARAFETVWTVDPGVVAEIARDCAQAAAEAVPEVWDRAAAWLLLRPISSDRDQTALATSIINRTLSYVS